MTSRRVRGGSREAERRLEVELSLVQILVAVAYIQVQVLA